MKKLYTVIAVLTLSLALGVTAMAQGKSSPREAKKAGCSSCEKSGATPEQFRKFKADSIDLRQEMMNKRFDLQRENLKETPDSVKVAAIKAELEAIKAKIDALKTAANLPKSASCGMEDCQLLDGNCDKCACGKKCGCKDCKDGKSCAKDAKAGKHCKNCDKKADCGCKECSCKECKGAACDKCNKAADCGCSKKGKAVKK